LSQLEAYGLTLAIEGVAAFLIAPRLGVPGRRAALAAVAGSALSHPVFWSATYALYGTLGRFTIPLLEGVVVAGEGLLYRAIATRDLWRAFALSFVANLASYVIGLVLTEWL
jgi:hypothetical protein